MKSQSMTRIRVDGCLICVVFLLALLFSLSACSSEKPDSTSAPPSESQEEKEIEVSAGPSPDQDSEQETSAGIRDRGKECKDHHYVLEAGATETLDFSTLLPLGEKMRPTEFKENAGGIEGTGVSMRLNNVTYEDFTESYNAWALDYGRHFEDIQAEIEKRKKQRSNVGYEIQIPMDVKIGSFSLGLNHDLSKGIAVIRKLGNRNSPQDVGKLSREEVAQYLGLQNANEPISLHDQFLNKKVSVSLIEITEERTRTVMNYSVLLRTPNDGGIRDLRKRMLHFTPTSSGRGMGVGVTSMWGRNPDPNELYFVISGPAEEVDCY
ncbi:MAG: hypothetical protein CVU57_02585 [Deltaproteobacteria bacterium HGW-Deltaproteobacteria-15]|jgi:hypothetical protein|nr:MAG: hypothetical protein CVU57_02585 [Deltaproteobacteria bacterium HGW-Deltaproteobacteria-15]